MAKNVRGAYALTGGATGALDAIDGAGLADKDMAVVITQAGFYIYALDVDSAAAESSPGTIKPDANAGDKRWILQGSGIPHGAANFTLFMNAAGTLPEWGSGVELISTTIDTATASGSQNIAGFGFRPSHVIILAIVDGTSEVCISFHNGPINVGIANFYVSTAGDWTLGSGIFLVQTAAIFYQGTVTMGVDGITVVWTKTGAKTGTARLYILGIR